MLKESPALVKNAGAQLVKARNMATDLVEQILIARQAVLATAPEMKAAGAKEMQYGVALDRLMDAARCDGLIRQAHDSLRQPLSALGFKEPSDADIVAILSQPVITPMGGGGGKSGGR
jgi:uncharacterized membrane protein